MGPPSKDSGSSGIAVMNLKLGSNQSLFLKVVYNLGLQRNKNKSKKINTWALCPWVDYLISPSIFPSHPDSPALDLIYIQCFFILICFFFWSETV